MDIITSDSEIQQKVKSKRGRHKKVVQPYQSDAEPIIIRDGKIILNFV